MVCIFIEVANAVYHFPFHPLCFSRTRPSPVLQLPNVILYVSKTNKTLQTKLHPIHFFMCKIVHHNEQDLHRPGRAQRHPRHGGPPRDILSLWHYYFVSQEDVDSHHGCAERLRDLDKFRLTFAEDALHRIIVTVDPFGRVDDKQSIYLFDCEIHTTLKR